MTGLYGNCGCQNLDLLSGTVIMNTYHVYFVYDLLCTLNHRNVKCRFK